MSTPVLATKLYIPPPRAQIVLRPRLAARLDEGRNRKLTLVSAPAGFGKTTLVSEWAAGCGQPVAWLSLDEGDNDPARFLAYLVAALQTLRIPGAHGALGAGVLAALQSPQPPPAEVLLTALLNEIAARPEGFSLVLDDYHALDSQAVDAALAFLIEHMPPQMRLVIASREDPQLPLARYRARGQLVELRAADLRFTPAEAADFLNQVMGLGLAAEDVAALEARTEGWVAGLQLAALALQGAAVTQPDTAQPSTTRPGTAQPGTAAFLQSFTGSHRFVLDYLLEEVLHQQPAGVQDFLLRTAILDRLCGPLCEAVLQGEAAAPLSGQATLEYLERANLFIVPLDNERRWYRYHHLFGDLLRQRLQHSLPTGSTALAGYHLRASQWFEDNGLGLEAFRHAAAANDIERAERLIAGPGMPLYFRGVAGVVLDWLAALPRAVLDARPQLWVRWATLTLMGGQTNGVEEKLRAAEAHLPADPTDERTRDLFGQIATARATLALTQYQPETILAQARRAQEYLHPANLPFRFSAVWTQAFAHHLLGERAAAIQAYREAYAISQASGDTFSSVLASDGLGQIQEIENQLYPAAESYRQSLALSGEHPQPSACETFLGLARILYQWNDLEAAEQHAQHSITLARQYDRGIDRSVIGEVFLARLKLARGEPAAAAGLLAQAEQAAHRHNFVHRLPEIAAVQVLALLQQGNLAAAARLADAQDLPLGRARVLLAQGDPAAALALLEPLRQEMEARGWQDERLRVMVLQAVALHARGPTNLGAQDAALDVLDEALNLAEAGGFIRLFVDEGPAMKKLLEEFVSRGGAGEYPWRVLAAFAPDAPHRPDQSALLEPLSEREIEVLHLLAAGLTNPEVAARLYLSLNTVKVHTRNIYAKLAVNNRTQALARARDLGILPRS